MRVQHEGMLTAFDEGRAPRSDGVLTSRGMLAFLSSFHDVLTATEHVADDEDSHGLEWNTYEKFYHGALQRVQPRGERATEARCVRALEVMTEVGENARLMIRGFPLDAKHALCVCRKRRAVGRVVSFGEVLDL